jgi:preprotein translocase subunit SecE
VAKPAKTRKKKTPGKQARKNGKMVAAKTASGDKPKKTEAKAAPKKKGAAKKQSGGLKGRISRAQAMKSAKQAKAAKGAPAASGSKTMKFLREVRLELSKVTWPDRDELVQATVAVLVAVAVSGVFIFLLDVVFSRLIGLAS